MRIAAEHVEDFGDFYFVNGGPLIVMGRVVRYVPAEGDFPALAEIEVPEGYRMTVAADTVNFAPYRLARPSGWYSDPDYPVTRGFAPVYVESDGFARVVNVHGMEYIRYYGDTSKLIPLEQPDPQLQVATAQQEKEGDNA